LLLLEALLEFLAFEGFVFPCSTFNDSRQHLHRGMNTGVELCETSF
jgi:hypothetical protein